MKYLLLLLITLSLQSNREIRVTLLNTDNQPQVSESLTFTNEQNETLGGCTTDTKGHCTIILETNIPEASIIRGTLITQYGLKPIIFKGPSLEIVLILNEDKELQVPNDTYVTRTPKTEPSPSPEQSPSPKTELSPEPEQSPSPKTELSPEPEQSPSPKTELSPQLPESKYLKIYTLQILLIFIFFSSIFFYIFSDKLFKRDPK